MSQVSVGCAAAQLCVRPTSHQQTIIEWFQISHFQLPKTWNAWLYRLFDSVMMVSLVLPYMFRLSNVHHMCGAAMVFGIGTTCATTHLHNMCYSTPSHLSFGCPAQRVFGSNALCTNLDDTMAVEVERSLRITYVQEDSKKQVWKVPEELLEVVAGVEVLTFAWRDRGCKRFLGTHGEELLGKMKTLRTDASENLMNPPAAAGEGLFEPVSKSAWAQFKTTTQIKQRLRDGEALEPLVSIPIPMPSSLQVEVSSEDKPKEEDKPKKIKVKSGLDARSSLQVEVSSEALQHLREAAIAWASSDSATTKTKVQKGTSLKWRADKQQWVAKKEINQKLCNFWPKLLQQKQRRRMQH